MDKESWWAAVHGVAKEWDMTQRLSTHIICLLSSILGIEKGRKKLSRIQSVLLSAFLLFLIFIYLFMYLGASLIAQLVKNPPAMRFNSWVGKIPWGKARLPTPVFLDFPCSSAGKKSACNMRDLGSIPGLGRSPGEGKGYPLQYAGLENPMDYSP